MATVGIQYWLIYASHCRADFAALFTDEEISAIDLALSS
jgi:hypothetical protein